MGYIWGSLLFLVRGGAPGAKDSNDHNHHNGDNANRDNDDQQHAAVQGGGGASMRAVTTCGGKPGRLLVFENSKTAHTQRTETSSESPCNALAALDTSVSCNLQGQD